MKRLSIYPMLENNNSLKVWIFLDIDGVLLPNNNFDDFVSENQVRFSPICLENLENVLRRYPQVFVAISSSWKEIFPFEMVKTLFSSDIADRIIGYTPFLNTEKVDLLHFRHQEVLKFLRCRNELDIPWIAIDDIPEHYPDDVNIIATDPNIGFDKISAMLLEIELIGILSEL